MLVRTKYKATQDGLAQRYWSCKHCKAFAEVAFFVKGSSGWVSETATNGAELVARERAENEMRTDEARIHALIVCPTCGQRAPGSARWAAFRVGYLFAIGGLLALANIAQMFVGAAAFGLLGCYQLWRERNWYRRSRGVILSKVEPGQLPAAPAPPPAKPMIKRRLAPAPDLPQARVLSAPAPAVREEHVDPSSGPRFLTEK